VDDFYGYPGPIEDIKSDLLKIEVYFQSLNIQQVTEYPIYPSVNYS